MRYFVLIMLLLTSLLCSAAVVYMQEDKNGNTAYSDIPLPDSQKMAIPDANVTSSPSSSVAETPTAATTPKKEGEKVAYSTFSIKSPANQDTFQNQRDIPIELAIAPDLQKGDTIQLYIDGQPVGQPVADTQITLHQPDRGGHQIYAKLLDSNQQVLKQSNSIQIFIHYASTQGQ